jgi:hypothetical protein
MHAVVGCVIAACCLVLLTPGVDLRCKRQDVTAATCAAETAAAKADCLSWQLQRRLQ